MSQPLVRLRQRPNRDGRTFTYMLDYIDQDGKRRRVSLGHAHKGRAQRELRELDMQLRAGFNPVANMHLRSFFADNLKRTGSQVRPSTLRTYRQSGERFILAVGNVKVDDVRHEHGERFLRGMLDRGLSNATAGKALREIKVLFNKAVQRGQIDENPIQRVKQPRCGKKRVRIFTPDECQRLMRSAREISKETPVRWDVLILVCLATGMRRSELANLTWGDVDFDSGFIEVNPKEDSPTTWKWGVKDHERRRLPVPEEVIQILADHQANLLEGNPYIFVPQDRYRWILQLQREGRWDQETARIKVIHNFTRWWQKIWRKAGIKHGTFHDLRRTALSGWVFSGLREFDVMHLAGHSSFETTRQFYLAVNPKLMDRTRKATTENLAHIWHAGRDDDIKGPDANPQGVEDTSLTHHARQDSNLRPTD